VIGVGGLVLTRIPEEIAKSRSDYYAKQGMDQDEAVNNDLMKEQHPSMPINVDRQTRVTFGRYEEKVNLLTIQDQQNNLNFIGEKLWQIKTQHLV